MVHRVDIVVQDDMWATEECMLAEDHAQPIMVCGTAETLVSRRVAEKVVPAGGIVVCATPSMAFAGQSWQSWRKVG